jgi:hypothetical protein
MRRRVLIALGLLAVAAPTARGDDLCLSATPPAPTAPPAPLRFGITPALAGTSGATQGSSAPVDPAKELAGLRALQPRGRRLVVRLNRLFEADGDKGIATFVAQERRYAKAGFDVESQVRYHPAAGQEGDMAAWEAYVRRAALALARSNALVALDITNEVNLPISSNTSDGAYPGALEALVRGVVAARSALDSIGRTDVSVGFTFAYRYSPDKDAQFWQQIGTMATPAFRAALGHVGLQLYPGLFWPPVLTPGQSAGDATAEALTLLRNCWMPKAQLGAAVPIWITENGYATNLGHDEPRQVTDLDTTLGSVHALDTTLGVTDYRYFNLRDNRPGGTDLFDDVGLLRSDYSRKPAFASFRAGVAADGARPRPQRCRVRLRVHGRTVHRWVRRGTHTVHVGRVRKTVSCA